MGADSSSSECRQATAELLHLGLPTTGQDTRRSQQPRIKEPCDAWDLARRPGGGSSGRSIAAATECLHFGVPVTGQDTRHSQQLRHSREISPPDMTFHPQINPRSSRIDADRRERQAGRLGRTRNDLLFRQAKEKTAARQRQVEARARQVEETTMQACTFKPQLNHNSELIVMQRQQELPGVALYPDRALTCRPTTAAAAATHSGTAAQQLEGWNDVSTPLKRASSGSRHGLAADAACSSAPAPDAQLDASSDPFSPRNFMSKSNRPTPPRFPCGDDWTRPQSAPRSRSPRSPASPVSKRSMHKLNRDLAAGFRVIPAWRPVPGVSAMPWDDAGGETSPLISRSATAFSRDFPGPVSWTRNEVNHYWRMEKARMDRLDAEMRLRSFDGSGWCPTRC